MPGPGPGVPWVLLKLSPGASYFSGDAVACCTCFLLAGGCVRRDDLVEAKNNVISNSPDFISRLVIFHLVPVAKSTKWKEKSCTWI